MSTRSLPEAKASITQIHILFKEELNLFKAKTQTTIIPNSLTWYIIKKVHRSNLRFTELTDGCPGGSGPISAPPSHAHFQ